MRTNTTYAIGALGLLLFVLFIPDEAQALQMHGEPEGLYVHQMAHLYYIFAVGYFYRDIGRMSFSGHGWLFLKLFCILMGCWNALAFIGHLLGTFLDPQNSLQTDCYLQEALLDPLVLGNYLYYIARLDHLLYVPALLFLCLGLRSFCLTAEKMGQRVVR